LTAGRPGLHLRRGQPKSAAHRAGTEEVAFFGA
jgi:hypothetical protein